MADERGSVAVFNATGGFVRGFGSGTLKKVASLVVDRAGVSVLRDPYSAKPYVLFYTTKRVGGGGLGRRDRHDVAHPTLG